MLAADQDARVRRGGDAVPAPAVVWGVSMAFLLDGLQRRPLVHKVTQVAGSADLEVQGLELRVGEAAGAVGLRFTGQDGGDALVV